MPAPTTQIFTGRMPFLLPNQQRQSTEGWVSKKPKQEKSQTVEHWVFAQAIEI